MSEITGLIAVSWAVLGGIIALFWFGIQNYNKANYVEKTHYEADKHKQSELTNKAAIEASKMASEMATIKNELTHISKGIEGVAKGQEKIDKLVHDYFTRKN